LRQRTQTDPLGRTTTWVSDEAGRPIKECRPGYGTDCIVTGYNDGLHATYSEKPGGTGVTLEYDLAGRVIRRTLPVWYGLDETTFGYDADGNQIDVTNAVSRVSRLFDHAGQLRCERSDIRGVKDSTRARGVTAWYDYDRQGRRSVTYMAGDGPSRFSNARLCDFGQSDTKQTPTTDDPPLEYAPGDTAPWPLPPVYAASADSIVPQANAIRYAYDSVGTLHSIANALWDTSATTPATWTFGYDAAGRMLTQTSNLPVGLSAPYGATWTYDAYGDLQSYVSGVWFAQNIRHDSAGRVTHLEDGVALHDYTFDGLGRLSTESRNNQVMDHFSYDPAGNRTQNDALSGRVTYQYGDGMTGNLLDVGRLVSTTTESSQTVTAYAYDSRGSTTGTTTRIGGTYIEPMNGDQQMDYDANDRLFISRTYEKSDRAANCGTSATVQLNERRYSYDGLGRRVMMQSRNPCAFDFGTWRYFWLDGNVAVKVQNTWPDTSADGSQEKPDEAWPAASLQGQWLFYAPGPENVLASFNGDFGGGSGQSVNGYVAGSRWVYGKDYRGSVVQTLCVTGGAINGCAVPEDAGYAAFGGGAADGQPGFNGAEATAGLVYLRNRWYDPNTGRFTQEDPIGFAGGINLYAYAGNDPVTFSDPYGLCIWDGCIAEIAAAGAIAGIAANAYHNYQTGQPITQNWVKAGILGAAAPVIVAGGGSALLARFAPAAAPAAAQALQRLPRPDTPNGMSMPEFGKVMNWGNGNADARAAIQGLSADALKAAGVTRDIAVQWANLYANEAARVPTNPSAAGRADLMNAAADLLK
jgi:RHS repeat-associated protein